MPKELLLAIIAGLGGMLGWGFSEFATKKSVDKIGSVSSLVWAHVFGTAILILFVFYKLFINHVHIVFPTASHEWLGIIFFGTLQTIVYYFSYKAFEKGEVSVLSPIFASFAGMVALISIILGETVTSGLVISLVLIFGGVILINLDIESFKNKSIGIKGVNGLKEIIIATSLATFWTLGWDKFTGDKDWLVYTTLMFVFMTISAYIIARIMNTNLTVTNSGILKFLWLIAVGEVIAYLAITMGYASTSDTAIVAVLSGASSLPTIILARIFLKEKMTRMQTIASLIIILGIILLSLS